MGKMPSGKGGEGGTEQKIFEGFLEKATQAIVYILSRSIRKKAPKRVFRTTANYGENAERKGWRGQHGARDFRGIFREGDAGNSIHIVKEHSQKSAEKNCSVPPSTPFPLGRKKAKIFRLAHIM